MQGKVAPELEHALFSTMTKLLQQNMHLFTPLVAERQQASQQKKRKDESSFEFKQVKQSQQKNASKIEHQQPRRAAPHMFLKKGSRKFLASKLNFIENRQTPQFQQSQENKGRKQKENYPSPFETQPNQPEDKRQNQLKEQVVPGIWLTARQFRQVYQAYCLRHRLKSKEQVKALEEEVKKLRVICQNQKEFIDIRNADCQASRTQEKVSRSDEVRVRQSQETKVNRQPAIQHRSKPQSAEQKKLMPKKEDKRETQGLKAKVKYFEYQLEELPASALRPQTLHTVTELPLVPSSANLIASLREARLVERQQHEQFVKEVFADKRTRISFSSGVVRDRLGLLQVVRFPNGDLKQVLEDGLTVYYYREGEGLEVVLPGGERLTRVAGRLELS